MAIIVFQHAAHCAPGRLGLTLRDHGFRLDIRRLDLLGAAGVPTDLDDVHGVISLGGPQNVGDGSTWMAAELDFLRRAHDRQLPLIGVCLGHQLIAAALGGEVGTMPRPEVGFHAVRLNPAGQTETLLAGIAWTSPQFCSHACEVTKLPAGATLLASSDACKVQAFRAGVRTYGFQYHFECDRAMLDSLAKAESSLCQAANVLTAELAAQAERHEEMFSRLADRLCVNIATFMFPATARLSA